MRALVGGDAFCHVAARSGTLRKQAHEQIQIVAQGDQERRLERALLGVVRMSAMHWKLPDPDEAKGFDDVPTVQRPVTEDKLRQARRSVAEPNEIEVEDEHFDFDFEN